MDEQVTEVFDDMLERSIPFDGEQQALIQEIAPASHRPGTLVCALGCSTATTPRALAGAPGPQGRLPGRGSFRPVIAKERAALDDVLIPRRGDGGSELVHCIGVRVVEASFRGHGFPGFKAVERD